MLIAGYSFGDDHLNEMILDAAIRRERSEFVVFCYADLPPLLCERAGRTPNVQLIGRTEAVLGGVRAGWKASIDAIPDLWEGGQDGKLALPDFTYLASYLARSSGRVNFRGPTARKELMLRVMRSTMPERDATCIGRVRHVLGATVTVALDGELAGVAPIYRGRLLAVGQIGSLVRIPQGLVDLVATVSLVGIAELTGPLAPAETIQRDERWLQVQLLGEIDRGTGRFQRGVGVSRAG